MRNRLAVVLVSAAVLTACAARRIPGTDIEDTDETRQILQVMEKYRSAIEARDADAILQLVSKSFQDDAGTTTPADDITFADLEAALPEHLRKLDQVRLDINVRRIEVQKDVASVIYYYNSSYRLPTLSTRAQNDSDLQQMVLRRDGDDWRIVSGI